MICIFFEIDTNTDHSLDLSRNIVKPRKTQLNFMTA